VDHKIVGSSGENFRRAADAEEAEIAGVGGLTVGGYGTLECGQFI